MESSHQLYSGENGKEHLTQPDSKRSTMTGDGSRALIGRFLAAGAGCCELLWDREGGTLPFSPLLFLILY